MSKTYEIPYMLHELGSPTRITLPRTAAAATNSRGLRPHNDLCQTQLIAGTIGVFRPAHAHHVRNTAPDTYWHGPGTPTYIFYKGKPSFETLALFQSFPSAP
jgi:hypothetical protein